MKKGKLYLIPAPLGESQSSQIFPPYIQEVVSKLLHFVVENQKSARRDLRLIFPAIEQAKLELLVLDKNTRKQELKTAVQWLKEGLDVGVISEAGIPSVADPGFLLVDLAHENHIQIVPLIGPSSIMMALSASGLNGQHFTFHGYLPIDKRKKRERVLQLESFAAEGYTQIFMETPYRNNQMLEDLQKMGSGNLRLCVACDLSLKTEYIKTLNLKNWKKEKVDLHKRPCLFLLGE